MPPEDGHKFWFEKYHSPIPEICLLTYGGWELGKMPGQAFLENIGHPSAQPYPNDPSPTYQMLNNRWLESHPQKGGKVGQKIGKVFGTGVSVTGGGLLGLTGFVAGGVLGCGAAIYSGGKKIVKGGKKIPQLLKKTASPTVIAPPSPNIESPRRLSLESTTNALSEPPVIPNRSDTTDTAATLVNPVNSGVFFGTASRGGLRI